jgi:hypothetical protein
MLYLHLHFVDCPLPSRNPGESLSSLQSPSANRHPPALVFSTRSCSPAPPAQIRAGGGAPPRMARGRTSADDARFGDARARGCEIHAAVSPSLRSSRSSLPRSRSPVKEEETELEVAAVEVVEVASSAAPLRGSGGWGRNNASSVAAMESCLSSAAHHSPIPLFPGPPPLPPDPTPSFPGPPPLAPNPVGRLLPWAPSSSTGSSRPREPTACDGCSTGTACCWKMHVFAAFVPSLSFADTGVLKMQIQHIVGDSLVPLPLQCASLN